MWKIKFYRTSFIASFLLIFINVAHANFDLSVIPSDGGTTLRFNRGDLAADVTHSVRLRISNSGSTQYQIFQQIISPLTNDQGSSIARPALLASVLAGSNATGTAYLQNFEPVLTGQQLIFTSTPTGIADSFTIVYRVDAAMLNQSGSFSGVLQFVLQPVSGGERRTVQMNIFVESNSQLDLSVEGSSAPNLVRVDSKSKDGFANAKLNFSGAGGGVLRIYQETLTFPANDLNFELPSGILKTSIQGGMNGEVFVPGIGDVNRSRTLIYKSIQSTDSVIVNFTLDNEKLAGINAGHYHGVIRFSFESDKAHKDFDIDLDVNISPIFEIVLSFPQGPINFTNVLPGSQPQDKEVLVRVNSNLGKPYSVIQHINQMMATSKGEEIPNKYFTMLENIQGISRGKVHSDAMTPVLSGDTVIYNSDKKGTTCEFKVIYRLSPYPDMKPGDYRSSIVYTLQEL